jgi:membrane peptidoglycan carboxypeptidase
MAGVYATLANHGKKVTPALVKSAEHLNKTVTMPDPVGDRAVSREAADSVTSVLTGVVDDGTAQASVRNNPKRDGQQVAGKTGTSDNNKSAWFTGYTPNLVTSVGLFGEDAKTHAQVPMYKAAGETRVNGGGFPAQIWAAYTFGVMGDVSKFDLDTQQGAAVQPTWTPTPTREPTKEPTQEPTTEEPSSSSPPPTTEEPSSSPPASPSTTPPTFTPPTAPETTPPADGGGGDPFDPVKPGDGQDE